MVVVSVSVVASCWYSGSGLLEARTVAVIVGVELVMAMLVCGGKQRKGDVRRAVGFGGMWRCVVVNDDVVVLRRW